MEERDALNLFYHEYGSSTDFSETKHDRERNRTSINAINKTENII